LSHFTGLSLAIIIGALTHVIWDSFTHENGWVVETWPVLNTMVSNVWTYDLQIFVLLQHLSTLTGLGMLGYWFWRWHRRTTVEKPGERYLQENRELGKRVKLTIWSLLASFSLVFGFVQGMVKSQQLDGSFALEAFVSHLVIGWMSGAAIIILLYSLIYRWGAINFLKAYAEEGE
jgi:hypothetical protein